MTAFRILLVEGNPGEEEIVAEIARRGGYDFLGSVPRSDALAVIRERECALALIDFPGDPPAAKSLCSSIRQKAVNAPVQIISIGETGGDAEASFSAGAQDFILRPLNEMELEVRVKNAFLRSGQERMQIEELEFYRKAVKQEEELSSKILERHVYLKETLASMKTMNRKLEKSNRKLERIAKYDTLSGLLNRRTLFGIMEVEVERAIRTGMPLAGIMIDIDTFKQINDNYGHVFGDLVIEELGTLMRRSLRKYDHAGRYGGEEFFIILPNTTGTQAYGWAERFRDSLADLEICFGGKIVPVTASLGMAQFRIGENREAWVSRADKAMYLAKEGGRNRTVME